MKQSMFAILVFLLPCIHASARATTQTLPNILWISCEDMSPSFSIYEKSLAHTPNLEKLAASGCLFTRAFSTSPVCSPSRSTIITGVYAATLGTHHHRSKVELPPDVKPFPAYLRNAGYYCTNNVKTDYNFAVPPDAWDEVSKKAHWRNRANPDQPFFAVFNLTVTHEKQFQLPDKRFEQSVKDVSQKFRVDPAAVKLPPYIPDTPVTRKDRARYYDMISQMDIEAGRILKQLKDDGLSSDTVIFFFSDHGVALPRGKRWLYDTGLHVPLIIRWPGVTKPGSRNDELASLIDLAPTMLSIAGLEIPAVMQGRVLLGPEKQPEPEYVFATRDRIDDVHDMSRAVRDRRFKYIKNFYPERAWAAPSWYMDKNPTLIEMRSMDADGKLSGTTALFMQPHKPAEELYDTVADPFEIDNLADQNEYVDRLETMRAELTAWQKRIHDKGSEPEESGQVRAVVKPKNRK